MPLLRREIEVSERGTTKLGRILRNRGPVMRNSTSRESGDVF
jgi:hypothetical protein